MEHSPPVKPRLKFLWISGVMLIVLMSVMGYSYYTPANVIAWADDLPAARAKSVETGKPILMEFSAAWCPACRAVKRNVWPDSRVEFVVNSRTIPLAVDVDAQRDLASQYGVNGIPAFIVTDATGQVLARKDGYVDADGVIALIDSAERAGVGGAGVSTVPR
ncbi:MAG: thioredoxin family protein [Phycisphaerales bacterium]